MERFSELIDLWPSLPEFAGDIGVTPGTAKQMRRRESVDSAYWLKLVTSARARGLKGVTFELLASLAEARKDRAA